MIHRTIILALPVLLLACAVPQSTTTMDVATFARSMQAKDVQLIDVRTPQEYASGHLEGALNMDWAGGQVEQEFATIDKTKPVLLYCASGRRSAAAREFLQAQGCTNVVDLAGGIGSWSEAGKPVVR